MPYFYTYAGQRGSRVFVRGIKDGKRFQRVVNDYPFELFVVGKKDSVQYSEHHIRSLEGTPMRKVDFPSASDMQDFVKQYKDAMKIYGQTSAVHQYITREFDKEMSIDSNALKVVSVDIEVEHDDEFPKPEFANHEIMSIDLRTLGKGTTLTFGTLADPANRDSYVHCLDEPDMLIKFITEWSSEYPDILTGWYIEGFDVQYLVRRIDKVLGNEWVQRLSPYHKSCKDAVKERYNMPGMFEILGVNILDYMDLYKKFAGKTLESYSLDFVCEEELGVGKVDYSEYGNSLMRLSRENPELFITYNQRDDELVEKLNDKLKFIELVLSIASLAHCCVNEALATVRPWDCFLYNMLYHADIAPPPEERKSSDAIIGGFVKEPIPGRHSWVVSFDLNSLYPSIIRLLNMSPETQVDQGEHENVLKVVDTFLEGKENTSAQKSLGLAVGANLSSYKQDTVGILPRAMARLLDERKSVKKEMLAKKQEVAKLQHEIAELEREVGH